MSRDTHVDDLSNQAADFSVVGAVQATNVYFNGENQRDAGVDLGDDIIAGTEERVYTVYTSRTVSEEFVRNRLDC